MSDVAEYLRLETGWYTEAQLYAIMCAAKAFIISYTGLTETVVNQYDDFYVAYLALCQHMYDARTFIVDKDSVNFVVKAILDMHCINLV